MSSKRSSAWAWLLVVVAATVSGDALATSKNDKNTSALGDPDAKDRIVFLDIGRQLEHPNLIAPCIKIRKNVYHQANDGKDFEVDFKITYTSRGSQVTKSVTVKVSAMTIDDDQSDAGKKYVKLETNVDITAQPVDAASKFTGVAKLFKVKDGKRELDSEATK